MDYGYGHYTTRWKKKKKEKRFHWRTPYAHPLCETKYDSMIGMIVYRCASAPYSDDAPVYINSAHE